MEVYIVMVQIGLLIKKILKILFFMSLGYLTGMLTFDLMKMLFNL